MAKDEFKTEAWTYMGRRLSSSGTIVHHWMTPPHNEVLVYDKLKADVIGGVHEVQVKRGADSTIAKMQATYVHEGGVAPERTQWQAEERADLALKERRSLEKKVAGSNTEYDEAIDVLRTMFRKMPSHARKSAFLWLVTEGISS